MVTRWWVSVVTMVVDMSQVTVTMSSSVTSDQVSQVCRSHIAPHNCAHTAHTVVKRRGQVQV